MSLERLVEEIRTRASAELAKDQEHFGAEQRREEAERDRRLNSIREESRRQSEIEIARERGQRIAAAKLESRKLTYEAGERRMNASLAEARELLEEFTKSSEYAATLRRMYAVATEELGTPVRIAGRSEDGPTLRKLAGKNFDPAPLPILGGLVAETVDGSRRLNLSIDELLRLRGDRLRELLSG